MGITFSRYRNYLALIGLIYCSKLGCAVTSRLYEALKVHVVARLWKADLKKYGQWAREYPTLSTVSPSSVVAIVLYYFVDLRCVILYVCQHMRFVCRSAVATCLSVMLSGSASKPDQDISFMLGIASHIKQFSTAALDVEL